MNTEQLRGLWQEAFGDTDDYLDSFFQTAFSPARCRYLIRDGALAAALYWFDCEYAGGQIAYLYAVATASRFRGRGLCHALMEQTHRHLASLGYLGTILVPGDAALFRLYAGMGYETCASIREFSCAPGPEAVPVRRIGAAEYAQRRRELLPQGSVIQEEENLALLQTQAQFYAGSDFLLAASVSQNVLQGLELLGNTAAAPGILRALDCSAGTFRAPGSEKAFAMYRPLTPGPAPSYFGFAFD